MEVDVLLRKDFVFVNQVLPELNADIVVPLDFTDKTVQTDVHAILMVVHVAL